MQKISVSYKLPIAIEKGRKRKEQEKKMHPNSRHWKRAPKKSFEIKFNESIRCMELSILDSDGMFPLVLKDPMARKIYHIERTKAGGLKMSAL